MKHLITVEEEKAVRAWAASPRTAPEEATGRLYRPNDGQPIRYVDAVSGRAHCRSCGDVIPKGERCIVFGFDASSWGQGHVADAYLHAGRCRPTTLLS